MLWVLLGSAWHNVKRRPVRTALTVLHIAVAVACVISVLGFDMHVSAVMDREARSSQDIVVASGGTESRTGMSYSRRVYPIFSDDDVAQLAADATEVEAISPLARHAQPIVIEAAGTRYLVRGGASVSPDYARVAGLEMVEGGFITQADVRQGAAVVVVAEGLAKTLFGAPPYAGRMITFVPPRTGAQGADTGSRSGAAQYRVIGVFRAEEDAAGSSVGLGQASPLLWPTTASPPASRPRNPLWTGTYPYETLIVKARSGKAQAVRERISSLVAERRAPGGTGEARGDATARAAVVFESSAGVAQGIVRERSILRLLLGGAVFIAVVVSAVGILSVMMVTIVERTREIGLRRALGASRNAIVLQFVFDSTALASAGGVLGALLALASYPLLSGAILGESFSISGAPVKPYPAPVAIAIGLALACTSGAVFGLVPALQAAGVEPAGILRES